MKKLTLKKKAAIVGIGEAGVPKAPGKTVSQVYAECCKQAIDDAGLSRSDIDGFLFTGPWAEPLVSMHIAEYLQIAPNLTTEIDLGGASANSMLMHAAEAVSEGIADYVLCASADIRSSSFGRSMVEVYAQGPYRHQEFEVPYGAFIPSGYALFAQRHMYEFGTTNAQMAKVAVTERSHAILTENAQMKKPITIDDCLNSKLISTPFHLFDCSLISDGGGAFIVCSAKNAKKLRDDPVYLLGVGEHSTHHYVSQAPSYTTTAAKVSGAAAFNMADLKPKNIDVAEIYDSFTMTVIILLEDLGFCKKGEGGKFVEATDLSYRGDLPLNTHGGLLSYCHPGHPGGIFHLLEATRQLMGKAGKRQVTDAETAIVHGSGGTLSEHSTSILGR